MKTLVSTGFLYFLMAVISLSGAAPGWAVDNNISYLSDLPAGLIDGKKAPADCVTDAYFGPGLSLGEAVTAQFTSEAHISGVGLFFGYNEFASGHIQYLSNGEWIDVMDVTDIGISKGIWHIPFESTIDTSAVRFVMTSGGGLDYTACFSEFEIYGDYTGNSRTDLEAAFQAGRKACMSDPASCGINTTGENQCGSVVSTGPVPTIHYPCLNYNGKNYRVDLGVYSSNPVLLFNVTDTGLVE